MKAFNKVDRYSIAAPHSVCNHHHVAHFDVLAGEEQLQSKAHKYFFFSFHFLHSDTTEIWFLQVVKKNWNMHTKEYSALPLLPYQKIPLEERKKIPRKERTKILLEERRKISRKKVFLSLNRRIFSLFSHENLKNSVLPVNSVVYQ